MSNKKLTQAEIYKIRYHIYREAGYSAVEASKMRSKKLNVLKVKLFRLVIFITILKK